MYLGNFGTFSNREDWEQAIDVVDENDDDVDISTATILFVVRLKGCTSPVLSATNGDGITIASPRFTISFDVNDVHGLCAGTYDVGCTITTTLTTQFIAGTLTVVDGIVP